MTTSITAVNAGSSAASEAVTKKSSLSSETKAKLESLGITATDGMTESDGGTPVYDIDVTAGSASREMIFADDRIIGHINVPGISLDSRIVRVSGDSMQPVINSGDYIAVREIRDLSVIYWGQIYVVVLDDYRMVKYLRKHLDCDKVILRSENPMYDDMELPRSAIRKLFFVDNIIHIDTRM